MVRQGASIWNVLLVMQGQLFPHFCIEYRAFFTGYHPTAEKIFGGGFDLGATETCLIMYSLQWGFALASGTNGCAHDQINFGKMLGLPFDLSFSIGDLVVYSTGLLSLQFMASMFKTGYDAAKDKQLALMSMIPYFQLNVMTYCAFTYSRFWNDHALWFIVYIGLLITNITGNLNLKSCANKAYNPIYIDPFLFMMIIYFDYNNVFETHILRYMYTYLYV